MKTFLNLRTVAFAAVLLLAGCAGTPTAPDADHNHPANPHATASPVPRLETGLLSLTNAAVGPAAAASAEHGHKHGDQ